MKRYMMILAAMLFGLASCEEKPWLEDVEKKLADEIRGVYEITSMTWLGDPVDLDGDGKTTGTEIYVTKVDKTTDTEKEIVKNVASVGFKNRGVKKSNFTVIWNAYQKCSVESALLEICFIDDADDMKIYTKNKDKIAKKIAEAIAKSYKLKLKADKTLKQGDKVRVKTNAKDLNTGKKYSTFVYKETYYVLRVDKGDKIAFGNKLGIVVGYTKKSNLKAL